MHVAASHSRYFHRLLKRIEFLTCRLRSFLGFSLLLIAACSTVTVGDSPRDEYQGVQLDTVAPNFELANQRSETVSLSDFRGNVVALTFMDSRCTAICPLTAVDLRRVSETLGRNEKVVFIGVNVNVVANTVEDVRTATEGWRLDEIPTWNFLTGSENDLTAVWEAYGIGVEPMDSDTGEVSHSPGVYLIDQAGRERWYVSTPFVQAGTPAPSRPLHELLLMHIRELLNESGTV